MNSRDNAVQNGLYHHAREGIGVWIPGEEEIDRGRLAMKLVRNDPEWCLDRLWVDWRGNSHPMPVIQALLGGYEVEFESPRRDSKGQLHKTARYAGLCMTDGPVVWIPPGLPKPCYRLVGLSGGVTLLNLAFYTDRVNEENIKHSSTWAKHVLEAKEAGGIAREIQDTLASLRKQTSLAVAKVRVYDNRRELLKELVNKFRLSVQIRKV